jgi:hypothetical protein
MNGVMNLRVPFNAGNLSSGYTTRGFYSSSEFQSVSLFCYVLLLALRLNLFEIPVKGPSTLYYCQLYMHWII